LNLAIPASKSQAPPVIRPLRTRAWVIHPHGLGDDRPAIIGYAYLSRVVYASGANATDTDPCVPGYVEDWAECGKVDIVDRGEPVPAEADSPSETLKTFASTDAEDLEARRDELDKALDDNALRSLIDANGIDVDGTDRKSMIDALVKSGASVS
jgi:hypothetical protein